jgi:hypothetical protein
MKTGQSALSLASSLPRSLAPSLHPSLASFLPLCLFPFPALARARPPFFHSTSNPSPFARIWVVAVNHDQTEQYTVWKDRGNEVEITRAGSLGIFRGRSWAGSASVCRYSVSMIRLTFSLLHLAPVSNFFQGQSVVDRRACSNFQVRSHPLRFICLHTHPK